MPTLSPRTLAAIAVAAAVAVTTAACSSPRLGAPPSSDATASTTTTTLVPGTSSSTSAAPAAGALQTGNYTDSPAGSPHYVIDVTSSTATSLAGSISFVYQDGRTANVGTFTGSAGNGRATLTIAPQGTTASATYTSTTLVLESCGSYLQYAATPAQCSFAYVGPSAG